MAKTKIQQMILEDMHSLRGDSLIKRDSSLNQIIDTIHSTSNINNTASQQISPLSGRKQQNKKSSQNLPQSKIVKRTIKKQEFDTSLAVVSNERTTQVIKNLISSDNNLDTMQQQKVKKPKKTLFVSTSKKQ